jgi:hypothetical protein
MIQQESTKEHSATPTCYSNTISGSERQAVSGYIAPVTLTL